MRISNLFIKAITAALLASPIACSLGGTSQSALSGKNGNGSGSDDCTLTQGYWKNHPDAWPVSSLKLGTVTYTKDQLIAILKTPVKGNGLIQLAHQLIAAKLNVAAGAPDSAIKNAIQQADDLIGGLVVPPVGDGSLATDETSSLNGKLDAFNNGDVGPGHCGDDDDDCDHDDDGQCDDDCDHDHDGDCDGDDMSCDHDTDGDGACDHPICGNTMVETGETCDDGNTASGDGCSATCQVEPCVCGDGHLDVGEACDDGNHVSGDGCSSSCTIELPVCGNGVVETGETCDDGNTANGDGCSSVCICEPCP